MTDADAGHSRRMLGLHLALAFALAACLPLRWLLIETPYWWQVVSVPLLLASNLAFADFHRRQVKRWNEEHARFHAGG